MVSLSHVDIIFIGGGAAGFFAAIHAAEKNKHRHILILEANKRVLSKVLISGGGRCNVTSSIFKPKELVQYYPRGHNYLLKPFQVFNSADTQTWFKSQGVQLKTEADGRAFPVSDDSNTIVDALVKRAQQLGIHIETSSRVVSFEKQGEEWSVETTGNTYKCNKLVVAGGGNKQLWAQLSKLDISIVSPVPSLFTFKITAPLLEDMAGISLPNVQTWLAGGKLKHQGPILITHEGLSGPATLKLSAWAARELFEADYKALVHVNWLGLSFDEVKAVIQDAQSTQPKKHVQSTPLFNIPKRFWKQLCTLAGIPEQRNYAEIGKKQINPLIELLTNSKISVDGKSTNKDEFVTAGGVDLEDINLESFEVKKHPTLYIIGEALNIDAVTGGFNFQGAWTTGYLAGRSL